MSNQPGPFEAVVCQRCGRIAPELPPEWEVVDADDTIVCEGCLYPDEEQRIWESLP